MPFTAAPQNQSLPATDSVSAEVPCLDVHLAGLRRCEGFAPASPSARSLAGRHAVAGASIHCTEAPWFALHSLVVLVSQRGSDQVTQAEWLGAK